MKTKRKNIFKSLLALTLALIMVLGVAPISELADVNWAGIFAPKAEAAEKTYTEGYYTYTVKDGGAIITDCDNTISGKITLPSKLGGYTVVGIGEEAFLSCDKITKISTGNNIEFIGKNAFYSCTALKEACMGTSVKRIYDRAFYYCTNLSTITFNGNNLKEIGAWAFYLCNFLTVKIPESVEYIGESAFRDCHNMNYINIPMKVNTIEPYTFYSCESLESVKLTGQVTTIGNGAFSECKKLCNVTIGNNVKLIGELAFESCTNLANVEIGTSVRKIGRSAFQNCSALTKIVIPESVEEISDCAFFDCDNLEKIYICDTIRHIGFQAFDACRKLTDVYYTGSKEQWKQITIDDKNSYLLNANIHYYSNAGSGVVIRATTNYDARSIVVGDTMEMTFVVLEDGVQQKKRKVSIAVENPEIFEISIKNNSDSTIAAITAKAAGTSKITVTDVLSGISVCYSLTSLYRYNACDLNNVPKMTDIVKGRTTNYYDYGGLIVDGMTSTKLSNGNYKVSMSVYNTKNIYGAVVTYYEDGSVCDYRMIDRFDCYETGLWDVLESMYYFPGQTANLFRKYTLYTNGNLAQKTAIDGIIVPKGGYMQITNNSEESAIAYLYNIVNFAVAGTLSAAGVITSMAGINVVDKSNVASKTAAEAIMKTIKSMPRDKAGDVMEDLLKDIAEQNMKAKSYDQIDDMVASTNNVLARAANIDMKSFISSSLKAVGISVAENVILSFLSTPGKWLSAIFTINSGVSYLDFSCSFVKSYKNTSIYVNAPRDGTISTMNGVKIDTQNNVDVKTVMQAFKIIDTSTITVNLSRNEVIEKSQIYNVYFTRDNEKVQPSGSVKIYLPLPDDYDPDNSYILRQESNGKWTKLETKRENDYLVAETDHFSLYAVAQVSKKDSIFKKILNVILAPFRAIINLFKKLFGK